jgi:threonine synthase
MQAFVCQLGTSGDTGSAAITAVKGLKWVDIVVLLPKGRITEIQERQMTTVISDNVHNFAGKGININKQVVPFLPSA